MKPNKTNFIFDSSTRINWLKYALIFAGFVLISRLFYLQIIKHEYYQQSASSEHSRLFNPSSPRGIIYLSDGNGKVPVVLNVIKFTVVANPAIIKDTNDVASKLSPILSIDSDSIEYKPLNTISKYVDFTEDLFHTHIPNHDECPHCQTHTNRILKLEEEIANLKNGIIFNSSNFK